jgi:hypothetical protein
MQLKPCFHWQSFFCQNAGNSDTQLITLPALATLGDETHIELFKDRVHWRCLHVITLATATCHSDCNQQSVLNLPWPPLAKYQAVFSLAKF